MHQHPIWIEIKQSFDQGQWPEKYCTVCQTVEKNNDSPHVKSKRQSTLLNYGYMRNHFGPLKDNQLYSLVVDTGHLCNFQCRSCTPWLSSSWIPEWNAMPKEFKWQVELITHKVWPHVPYDIQKDDISQLKFVNFLGGEPLYNVKAYGLMEKIFEDTKGDCMINLSTNGSLRLDVDKYPYLKKFRRLNLTYSIDAIGQQFDFIRTGGNWKKVASNIDHAKSLPNVRVGFHAALSVLNLFEIPKLKAWAQETDLQWPSETTYVTDPTYLSYKVLTDKEKDIIYQWLDRYGYGYMCDVFSNYPFDPTEREKFFRFMEHTKNYHGMDWQEYLPQLYKLMTQH